MLDGLPVNGFNFDQWSAWFNNIERMAPVGDVGAANLQQQPQQLQQQQPQQQLQQSSYQAQQQPYSAQTGGGWMNVGEI
jgi:hypothetical protein